MTDHAQNVYRYAASAMDESETNGQATDLLIDAAAFAISENGGTLEEAIERLKESVETFQNTSAVTH